MEVLELLSIYDFPRDDLPVIRGAARPAVDDPSNDDNSKCIDELMAACDEYIPEPPRETDKDFLMPVEDVFYPGPRYCGDRSYRAGHRQSR